MLQDALLAWLHFLAIFLLVAVLTAQAVLLRPGISPTHVFRLAFYDRIYLLSASGVVVTGALRLALGVKGADFYLGNPWFHAKIGFFILIGACSIPPTRSFIRWRRQAKLLPGYVPEVADIARARRWVMWEAHLLPLVPLCAVLMARGL